VPLKPALRSKLRKSDELTSVTPSVQHPALSGSAQEISNCVFAV